MERNSVKIFRSFYDAAKMLPDKETRADYLMAILQYAFDGVMPETDGTAAAMFLLVKPNLDVSIKKSEAGASGGQASRKQTASKPQAQSNQTNSKAEADGKQAASKSEPDKGIRNKDKGYRNKDIGNNNKSDKSPIDIAMDKFAEHRKALRKQMSPGARELILDKLEELAPGDEQKKIAIINQSIERGWQGVFPLKEDNTPKPTQDATKTVVNDDLDRLARLTGVET